MKTLRELSDMSGRRVLITGGTGYLGQVIAETLAEMGASIILLDRSNENFNAIQMRLKRSWGSECTFIECDLESEEQRMSAIEQVKSQGQGLDCLINNAAFGGTTALTGWITRFEEQSLESWRRALEVNLTASFHLSQALAPEIANSLGRAIVNITSIYGDLGPDWRLYTGTTMGNPAAYGVSKGGAGSLTRWLATTLAPDIRVNGISPGGIFRNQPEEFVSRYKTKVPLGRMATEEDFKGIIALLASDLSKYITGQIYTVDGGLSVW